MQTDLIPLLLLLVCASCTKEEALAPDCGAPIQVMESVEGLVSDHFILEAASAEDRCLTVTVGASGCTSAAWTLDLVTTGDVQESNPTRSEARLVFNDQVEGVTCQAYLTRTFSFDLSPYLTADDLPSRLSLIGTDSTLLIE